MDSEPVVVDFDAPTTCAAPVNINAAVYALKDELVSNRRWFHAHPELSFKEYETVAKIAEILRGYGLTEVFEGCGKTGLVGLIRGEAGPGPCVALRADCDGLPVTETAGIAYKSQNVGVMHACGHDGHMSELLAVAKILFAQKSRLKGVIKLVFQPAEEGYGGAPAMIKDGVLEDGPFGPRVDIIYGIHIWSENPVGVVQASNGPVMAASDRFDITVNGKGGHGAAPQHSVDAVVEAAALVTSLQTIVSRSQDPLETGVVTCGMINGGYAYNVIADKVVVSGTCRTFKKETQSMIKRRMCEICCGVASTYGGQIDLDYKYGYPPTVNAYPDHVDIVRNAAAKIVGVERSSVPQCTMGAEDFSYFLEQRPGCFFFVGAALPGENRPHHKSVFDFDENAMLIGASTFLEIVYHHLC